MAEFAIWVDAAPVTHPLGYRRGDVIIGKPDGWQWSAAELAEPRWRIVKLPGVDPSVLSRLHDYLYDPPNPVPVARRRMYFSLGGSIANTIINSASPITLNVTQRTTLFSRETERTPAEVLP